MSGINQDTVNRLDNLYSVIVGQGMTKDELNQILSVAAQNGINEEFYISQLVMSRANRVIGERNASAIQKSIDSGIKGSNIEQSTQNLISHINNLYSKGNQYLEQMDKRATEIIGVRAASIASKLSSQVNSIIIEGVREDIKTIISDEMREMVKIKRKSLRFIWCSIGLIIGSIVTYLLNHPDKIIRYF